MTKAFLWQREGWRSQCAPSGGAVSTSYAMRSLTCLLEGFYCGIKKQRSNQAAERSLIRDHQLLDPLHASYFLTTSLSSISVTRWELKVAGVGSPTFLAYACLLWNQLTRKLLVYNQQSLWFYEVEKSFSNLNNFEYLPYTSQAEMEF
jgi:hypothetical protein